MKNEKRNNRQKDVARMVRKARTGKGSLKQVRNKKKAAP